MTGRSDIATGRLTYTCRCGWIDWGHANPTSARSLWDQVKDDRGSPTLAPMLRGVDLRLGGHPAFVVWYAQSSSAFGVTLQFAGSQFLVRKALPQSRRQEVASAISQSISRAFETQQGRGPLSLVSNSSFSLEDLVSNMLGFYRAVRGISLPSLRALCGPVSQAASYDLYDRHLVGGIGSHKWHSFTTPKYFACKACQDTPQSMPPVLTSIQPAAPGEDFVRLERHIPGEALRPGTTVYVDRRGHIEQISRRPPR